MVSHKIEHGAEPWHPPVSLHSLLHRLQSVVTLLENAPTGSRRGIGWCHVLSINKLTLRTHQSVTTSQPRRDKPMRAHGGVRLDSPRTGHVAEGETPLFLFFFSGTVPGIIAV